MDSVPGFSAEEKSLALFGLCFSARGKERQGPYAQPQHRPLVTPVAGSRIFGVVDHKLWCTGNFQKTNYTLAKSGHKWLRLQTVRSELAGFSIKKKELAGFQVPELHKGHGMVLQWQTFEFKSLLLWPPRPTRDSLCPNRTGVTESIFLPNGL